MKRVQQNPAAKADRPPVPDFYPWQTSVEFGA